jgi:hypothetical protein
MTGSQRWNYSDWMLKAYAEKNRKQRIKQSAPQSSDIFKFGISQNEDKDEVKVYNRKNGKDLFEVESYHEAQRLLHEEYEMGA